MCSIHLHQYGDLNAADGTSAGLHLDFAGNSHALPSENLPRHMVLPDPALRHALLLRFLHFPLIRFVRPCVCACTG
jgi:hypothetical protein